VGKITGDPRRLDLLEQLVGSSVDASLLDTLLPKDLEAFDRFVAARRKVVESLLAEGRELVEQVERLVCALYDVPDDLGERIVEHADSRAVRAEL
jgi:hypothetical protein